MSQIVVGVADCRTARQPGEVLITYALGSCIGMTVYDPATAVGGMLHFMLPDSSIDPAKRAETPYKYADTGIPLLLAKVTELGGVKRRLVVRIAGGAQMMDASGVFDIGKRNYQALRKILWKVGVLVHAEAVGGSVSRTIRLEIGSGRLWLREAGGAERELPPSPGSGSGDKSWHIAS
jgi:chemotaxis protein CheD